MSLVHQIADFVAHQQVLAGFIGAAATGGLLFWARELPRRIGAVLMDQFTVSLSVEESDQMFGHLSIWFARNRIADQVRRLMLQPAYDYDKDQWRWEITLGRGWHMAWFKGRPMFVNREIEKGGEVSKLLGGRGCQRLWIITPGRRQDVIRELVGAAEEIYNQDGRVKVFFWHGGAYQLADRRRPRSVETVYLPEEQKARVIQDVSAFVASREKYAQRGTPWRRGYLLEGPPGTAKTTLIFAIAGLLGKNLYTVNLNNISGDNNLMAACNEVPADGILVMEDIDTADITKERDPAKAAKAPAAAPGGPLVLSTEAENRGVSLSGLLNAIDGVAAREGRLLFMTSNFPDRLDSALLRPGRVDVRERLDLLQATEAMAMFRAYHPEADEAEFSSTILPHLPMSGAQLQGLLQAMDAGETPSFLERTAA